jgi:hypothetical protein
MSTVSEVKELISNVTNDLGYGISRVKSGKK